MMCWWKIFFFLWICNLLVLTWTINPIFFPCENDTFLTKLDCKNRNLSRIPLIKSDSVLFLNLDENNIHMIERNALAEVPNLQIFSMKWNCPPDKLKRLGTPPCHVTIDKDAFVHLKNLTHLLLAANSLMSVPALPEFLEVLGLEFNHIFNIQNPFGATHLKVLLLSKNCYYENPCNQTFVINEKVFQDLPELQNLTLGYNNITSVPKGLPESLESLDFRENKINKIDEMAFANLRKLKSLNLEWNCQRCDHAAQPCFPCPNNSSIKLHPRVFRNLNQITSLSLRGNSLKNIPDGIFRGLSNLTFLDLSDNLLAYVIRNGTFFSDLKNVKSLNLIYNYEPLKSFKELILSPNMSEMSSLEDLLLSGYFFRSLSPKGLRPLMNLKNLQHLDLRMNLIQFCKLSLFSSFKTLKKVILSQNMMDFITPDRSVTNQLNPQNIQTMEPVIGLPEYPKEEHEPCNLMPLNVDIWTFQRLYCQRKLFFDLSQNNILTLNGSIFTGMEKIVCLDLSRNYLSQSLNGEQFQPLINLQYLNMAHNRIDMYFVEAFQELRKTLRILDLTNNEFHFRMKGMGHRFDFIQNLTSLEVLSLSENNIGIRISVTLESSSLKFLFFSGNRLDIMWDYPKNMYLEFFKKLTNLIYLDISNNQLISLSPEVFCNFPKKLQTLKVSNNNLKYFPWQNLTVLTHLFYLNLSWNSLNELPSEAIKLGDNLTVLDLSHNYIELIPEAFFQKADSLKYLNLSYNQLKFLGAKTFTAMLSANLRSLTLHTNPFICNCDTSWFMYFLRRSTIYIPQLTTDVRCVYPESQNGALVLSMDPRSCQEIYGSIGFLITTFLVIMMTAVPLLNKLYGWDLWYCVHVFWAGHKGYSQLLDKEGEYDAFVVFDILNVAVRDWVYNELIVNLENGGKQQFHLCLEERDWVPGISCIENLHNAVYNSRKTVFILTATGSVSGIPRQSFFMVQQRLLDEKLDTIILVLLDEIFPKSKYLQMRKMICRKSVLSWPRNPHAHQHFWNKLRTVLALDNSTSYSYCVGESLLTNDLI